MKKGDIKNFLPIGSVVTLSDDFKKLMIIGRIIVDSRNLQQYDYCGCPYPEGIMKESVAFKLFDIKDIAKVHFHGFEDEEEEKFKDFVDDVLEKKDYFEK